MTESNEEAPTEEQLRLQVLGEFIKGYEALGHCHSILKKLVGMAYPNGTPVEHVVKPIQLISTLVAARVVLDDVHHQLGHELFDACWDITEVGEEFKDDEPGSGIKSLFEMLGFEVESRMLDPDNLPDDLAPELKEQIQDVVARTRKARKSGEN